MKRPVSRPVISVGSGDPVWTGHGVWLDGAHPIARPVTMGFDDTARNVDRQTGQLYKPGALILRPAGADAISWPYHDIRTLPGQARTEGAVLGLASGDSGAGAPARLIVGAHDLGFIRIRAKKLRRAPTVRGGWKLAILGAAAIASVALMVTVLVPTLADALADYLPPEGEAALGEATLGQIRAALDETGLGLPLPLCEAPDGIAALDTLATRLTDQAALTAPLTVTVLDHAMVNAFALPGGNVVLFRGLIDAAEAPEEVAAVLAHEIGHVAARDPITIALRSAGSIGVLGLLFGDFAGGALVLFLAEQIVRADYTRQAEAAADAYGLALLTRADIAPDAMATFFERLAARGGQPPAILSHFLAHPELEGRIDAARLTSGPDVARPVLEAPAWAALQSICD